MSLPSLFSTPTLYGQTSVESSNSCVMLKEDNLIEFVDSMVRSLVHLGEDCVNIIRNIPLKLLPEYPTYDDLACDRNGVAIKPDTLKYRSTAGAGPNQQQMSSYEKDSELVYNKVELIKKSRAILASSTFKLISSSSKMLMNTYDSNLYSKSSECAITLWALVYASHAITNVKLKMDSLTNLLNLNMVDNNFMEYSNSLVELVKKLKESYGDLNKLSAESFVDSFVTTLMISKINPLLFAYQISVINHSDFDMANFTFPKILKMLLDSYKKFDTNSLSLANSSIGRVISTCVLCHSTFPYAINARTGNVHQKCSSCYQKDAYELKNKTGQNLNLSLNEIKEKVKLKSKKPTAAAVAKPSTALIPSNIPKPTLIQKKSIIAASVILDNEEVD